MNSFEVHAAWLNPCKMIGTCFIDRMRGKEVISFQYDPTWLSDHAGFFIDPDIYAISGRQYPPDNKPCFGFLADTAPDRWGRLLISRKERMDAAAEGRLKKTLMQSDYILRVCDEGRIGGLRYWDSETGSYLSDRDAFSVPPMEDLRKLEAAASSADIMDADDSWVRTLCSPGSSLGGARPKANVVDENGDIWIAKFPAKNDEYNMEAWEMVAHDLAMQCGLIVPDARLISLSNKGATYLSKRFDRVGGADAMRVHYLSAMTALGENDDSDNEIGYIDIASVVEQRCDRVTGNLNELWRRMVFNICVSNTDDHLRNHGFILRDGKWELSPVFDCNPNVDKVDLSLLVGDSYEKSLTNAIEISGFFRIDKDTALKEAVRICDTVQHGRTALADKYSISKNEQRYMEEAFSSSQNELVILKRKNFTLPSGEQANPIQ